MPAIGSSVTSPLPTDLGSTDTWGGELNTLLAEIIDIIETKISSDSMNISGNVDMNSNGIDELTELNMVDNVSASASNRSIYWKGLDLYVKDGSGNEIQVTSGGSLL